MPATAAERGLLDPFDPVQACRSRRSPAGAATAIWNLGLAAAAYNAGPRRVQEWLNGAGGMPQETRDYVFAITGRPVDDWIGLAAQWPTRDIGCGEMMALLQAEPTPYITALEQRIVSGAARPWGVQLAAGFSRDNALVAYARMVKRFGGMVDDLDPIVSSSALRSRGTRPFYQIRIGAESTRRSEHALRTHPQDRRRLPGAAPGSARRPRGSSGKAVTAKMRRVALADDPSIVRPWSGPSFHSEVTPSVKWTPRKHRGSSLPATAAIDNETLDHLLSVVNDASNLRAFPRFARSEVVRGGRRQGVTSGQEGAPAGRRLIQAKIPRHGAEGHPGEG